MIEQQASIKNYLTASADTFWQWRDRGEVAVWANGPTIVFREELAHVVAHLAPAGLPPLGAILLLIAATRDNWRELSDVTGMLASLLDSSEAEHVDKLYQVIEGLNKVSELEPALRSSLPAKAVLAEVVFEDAPHSTELNASFAIAEAMSHPLDEAAIFPDESFTWWNDSPQMLLQALRSLAHGLSRATPGRLKLRRQTSLDQLPGEAEVDLPAPLRARALLGQLKADDELSGFAQVASRLLAAVSIPRPMRERDELPVGGVSDITNRGSFDKLLISELAHDDLTLAARLVMNEALYLRRESPPKSPPRRRTMLLETGLRSWGVPRVYATAVALALAATAERDADVRVFRARRDRIVPVDLTTRAGLIEHLSALESELHPGAALDAFQQEATPFEEGAAEPILIASEDVLADREFQRALSERMRMPLYLASVSRDGRLRIIERTARGSKPLKDVQIELDSLFVEPTAESQDVLSPKLIDREWARNLPAIFSVEPFPLLLPHNVDPKKTWWVEGYGALSITKDRRLMWWKSPGLGARQLDCDLPRGALWWCSASAISGPPCAVVGGFYLLRIDPDDNRLHTRPLSLTNEVRGFCSHNGVLFAICRKTVDAISLETGRIIESYTFPFPCKHVNARFFQGVGKSACWYALTYDGQSARFETVVDGKAKRSPKLLSMFECVAIEGPIGITVDGNLYITATDTLKKFDHKLSAPLKVEGISPLGDRVGLCGRHSGRMQRVELEVETEMASQCFAFSWEPESVVRKICNTINVRHRFTQVGIHSDGVLALRSRKGQDLGFAFNHAADSLSFTTSCDGKMENGRSFKPVSIPRAFRLSRASWDDGSEAFLDSRGLLHLRSSNSSLPEITIILTEYETGGWCSDGTLFGRPYFTGKGDHVSGRHAWNIIQEFVRRLR